MQIFVLKSTINQNVCPCLTEAALALDTNLWMAIIETI